MGNNQSTGTKVAITAGVIGGVVLTVATLGAAAPLVIGGAEGAYAYHQHTTQNDGGYSGGGGGQFLLPQLEAEHLLFLGAGTVAASSVSSSSRNSRSTHTTSTSTTCFEKKTIYDWWGNGITCFERQELLNRGYGDRSGCFTLQELNEILDRICFEKAPGKPTEKDGFKPKKGQNGKTAKAPNSEKRGYLDENDNVWVPTGQDTDNVKQHGGPHWDVQHQDGTHENVYPGGEKR